MFFWNDFFVWGDFLFLVEHRAHFAIECYWWFGKKIGVSVFGNYISLLHGKSSGIKGQVRNCS